MILRKYKKEDIEEIEALFYETVHTVNAKDYKKEQLAVWATGSIEREKWNQSFLEHYTIVALEAEKIIGFGDISNSGYLDRLYIHKDYQGKGIATAICKELEKSVIAKEISVHASITAKGFFEKRGYGVVKEQEVEKDGIYLKNYVMVKNA